MAHFTYITSAFFTPFGSPAAAKQKLALRFALLSHPSRSKRTASGAKRMSMPHSIGIVVGSTRPGCNGRPIALWIQQIIANNEKLRSSYNLIDLADWNLPLLDEPGVPARDPPVHEHTKAWRRRVETLDGFLFVTPQVRRKLQTNVGTFHAMTKLCACMVCCTSEASCLAARASFFPVSSSQSAVHANATC